MSYAFSHFEINETRHVRKNYTVHLICNNYILVYKYNKYKFYITTHSIF